MNGLQYHSYILTVNSRRELHFCHIFANISHTFWWFFWFQIVNIKTFLVIAPSKKLNLKMFGHVYLLTRHNLFNKFSMFCCFNTFWELYPYFRKKIKLLLHNGFYWNLLIEENMMHQIFPRIRQFVTDSLN